MEQPSKVGTLNKADLISIGTNTLISIASVYVPLLTIAIQTPGQFDAILLNPRFLLMVVAFAILKTIQKTFQG